MLHQHFVFAVNRHKVFRLDQLQHQLLFLLRGMSSCMQIAQDGFCQYIGTGAKQLVDHLIDACTVARNRTGGKDNRIAWNQLDVAAVSYTHLDVYKRQMLDGPKVLKVLKSCLEILIYL